MKKTADTGQKRQNKHLNGVWMYRAFRDPGKIPARFFAEDYDACDWKNVLTPVQMPPGTGSVCFLREFELDKSWMGTSGSPVFLQFQGAGPDLQLWINGHVCAAGNMPLCYDITPFLHTGVNRIAVRADRTEQHASEPCGIYGSVTLYTESAQSRIPDPVSVEQQGCLTHFSATNGAAGSFDSCRGIITEWEKDGIPLLECGPEPDDASSLPGKPDRIRKSGDLLFHTVFPNDQESRLTITRSGTILVELSAGEWKLDLPDFLHATGSSPEGYIFCSEPGYGLCLKTVPDIAPVSEYCGISGHDCHSEYCHHGSHTVRRVLRLKFRSETSFTLRLLPCQEDPS